ALRAAWFRPRIWLVKRSTMARPAASSLALLIRRPDERRCRAVASWLPDVDRLRCAFSDITLVLMIWGIYRLLKCLHPHVIRPGAGVRPEPWHSHRRYPYRRLAGTVSGAARAT